MENQEQQSATPVVEPIPSNVSWLGVIDGNEERLISIEWEGEIDERDKKEIFYLEQDAPLTSNQGPGSHSDSAEPAATQPKQIDNPNLNAGNNVEKWKTQEERIVACEKYCQYLRAGRSKKYYPDADENTINRYIKLYPREFRPEKIADAERAGLALIEDIGFKGMRGHIPGFNATVWIWLTKNKMKWTDRVDHTSDGKTLPQPIAGGQSVNVHPDDSNDKA